MKRSKRAILWIKLVRTVRAVGPVAWFLRRHWAIRVGMLVTPVLVTALTTILFLQRERATSRELTVAAHWSAFDRFANKLNASESEAAVRRVLAVAPEDQRGRARLRAFETGEGEPGDGVMLRLLMNQHAREGRRDEAVREAGKLAATEGDHWQARCLLADAAFRNNQRDEALRHLEALPPLEDQNATATPGVLLFALQIHRELGRDPSDILDFMEARIAPFVRLNAVDALSPLEKQQLLMCYREAILYHPNSSTLSECWTASMKLARQMMEAPDASPSRLLVLASVVDANRIPLNRLRQTEKISDAEAALLGQELDRTLVDAWTRLRADQPTSIAPFLGLAKIALLKSDRDGATKHLVDGLKACGNQTELVSALAAVLRDSEPGASLQLVELAVQVNPTEANLWKQLAVAASAAGRPDRALEACRQYEAKTGRRQDVAPIEAGLHLAAGKPTAALEALASMGPHVEADPAAMELWVRAAGRVGGDASAADKLTMALKAERWDVVVGGAVGFVDLGKYDEAVTWCDQVLIGRSEHWGGRLVRAVALTRRAEPIDDDRWNAEALRVATTACEWLLNRRPNDRVAAEQLAWLQLKGLHAVDLARNSAEPLRRTALNQLTPRQAHVMGCVESACGRPNEAMPYLNRAVSLEPTAERLIDRAAAEAAQQQWESARRDLDAAAMIPRTGRVSLAWKRIDDQLRGVK